MTAVAQTLKRRTEDKTQDGKAYFATDVSQWRWSNNIGSAGFTAGEYSLISRFELDVPKGATITSATVRFEYRPKDRAVAQTVSLQLNAEATGNSARWPEPNDSLLGASFPRTLLTPVAFTISHPAGLNPSYHTESITSLVQALVNREDWEAGNYATFTVYCVSEGPSSDMSIMHRNDDFAGAQFEVTVNYTYDDTWPDFVDVNRARLETFEVGLPIADVNAIASQSFFASRAEGTTWETESAAPALHGTTALHVMSGAPAGQYTRSHGVYFYNEWLLGGVGETVVFAGWFYNPASNVGDFYAGFPFNGIFGDERPERDVWTPFATPPYPVTSTAPFWAAVEVKSANPGEEFYVDGLTIVRSNHRMQSFTPSRGVLMGREHVAKQSNGLGVSIRRGAASRYFRDGSTTKPRRTWAKASDSTVNNARYVPVDSRRASLAARQPLIPNGTTVLASGVVYNGRVWTRATVSTAGHGVRVNVPLSRLTNAATYSASWYVANDTGASQTVNVDWCDGTVTSVVVPAGSERRIVATTARSTYDATFRFTDVSLSAPGSILIAPDEVRVVPA